LLKVFSSNGQATCDSAEKRQSYRPFNMSAYRFFSIKKCSRYYTNAITSLKKTQLTNDQMPKFHCQCDCSKCQPSAPRSNTIF